VFVALGAVVPAVVVNEYWIVSAGMKSNGAMHVKVPPLANSPAKYGVARNDGVSGCSPAQTSAEAIVAPLAFVALTLQVSDVPTSARTGRYVALAPITGFVTEPRNHSNV